MVQDQQRSADYEAFNGLGKTNPLLAFAMTVAMCSLGGIPLTAGFFAKFFVFSAVLQDAQMMWLVIIAVVLALIGLSTLKLR